MLRPAILLALATSLGAQPAPPHWAFRPVVASAPPRVAGIEHAVDAFVRARLRDAGIAPAPTAAPRTLLRRLHLDLLGLPPSPEQVRAFVTDRGEDAWQRVVDACLASPHFGERWGRHWLDVARYADSDGYEKDGVRPHAWRWRDWVIDAINRDMPFDRFVIEQLAGDLLPDAADSQRLATGFHRNTLSNREGGVDREEYRVKAVVDRVNTTATAFLGLTVGCAQCHDHKYDPITQREYYGMFAFFDNADEVDIAIAPDQVALERFDQARRKHDQQIAALHAKIKALRPALEKRCAEWERGLRRDRGIWNVLEPSSAASREGAVLTVRADGSVLASGRAPDNDRYTIVARTTLCGISAVRLEVLPDPSLPSRGPGRTGHGNFVLSELSLTQRPTAGKQAPKPVELRDARATFAQDGFPADKAVDGEAERGWAIGGALSRGQAAVFETPVPVGHPDGTTLVFELDQSYGSRHTIGRLRLSVMTAGEAGAPLPAEVAGVLRFARADRTVDEQQTVLYYYASIDPETRPVVDELIGLEVVAPAALRGTAMVLGERRQRRPTHVHVRGDFLRKGVRVRPSTPAVLPPLDAATAAPSRLDLARWIVRPDNPLAARVAANRIWQHLFGHGLMRSPGDWGSRGERPSHPALLDWLAAELVQSGWSRKYLIRTIVTSQTYRQSSRIRPELEDRDAQNALLARQNRFRVEAEIVRDLGLAASGLLEPRIGGPSVRPYLPAGVTDLGYAGSVRWQESPAPDRYRRGLYIHFQRTVPYPGLTAFDCPDASVSVVRRGRSNTPIQALTTLNDPVFVECAQALARRVLREADYLEARLERLLDLALGRRPTPREAERLALLLDAETARYAADAVAARSMCGATLSGDAVSGDRPLGEQAAWVVLARVVLNLDELLTRG